MMTVGFLGAGNMGSALARAAAKSGDVRILIADKDGDKARAVATEIGGVATDITEVAEKADIIFLGMKPHGVGAAIEEIRESLRDGALIVSMAAAVDIKTVEKHLCRPMPIIRIMPNTPVAVGEGLILFSPNEKAEGVCEDFLRIMKFAGDFERIDEALMDAAACISGCGPAFAFTFIDALAKGGEKCGLDRDMALLFAEKTLRGAAAYALASERTPEELRDAVCSPGGTTIEGVKALEAGNFTDTVGEAVVAAYKKTLIMKAK